MQRIQRGVQHTLCNYGRLSVPDILPPSHHQLVLRSFLFSCPPTYQRAVQSFDVACSSTPRLARML
jgi:hypothetical protein